ncbi:MAG: hypothetical protein GY940_38700 [bacterium]|nr:hypothetical protein [bacterium]
MDEETKVTEAQVKGEEPVPEQEPEPEQEKVEEQEGQKQEKTRAKVKKNFERWFRRRSNALDLCISDPVLKAYTLKISYDETEMAEGVRLRNELETAYITRNKAGSDQVNATRLFDKQKEVATVLIKRLLKAADFVFQDDPDAYKVLGLADARKSPHGDWFSQNKVFLTLLPANQAYIDKMASIGVTQAEIEEAKAELVKAILLDQDKENKRAVAQNATEVKNIAYNDFDAWINPFLTLMRAILYKEPQLKEQLGFVTRSKV